MGALGTQLKIYVLDNSLRTYVVIALKATYAFVIARMPPLKFYTAFSCARRDKGILWVISLSKLLRVHFSTFYDTVALIIKRSF